MNPRFAAILNKKETIHRDTIEELAAIPHLEHYFKIELHREVKNTFNTDTYYKYTPVDKDGNRVTIDCGEFQITEIAPESKRLLEIAGKRTYFTSKDILVYDKSAQTTHIYKPNVSVKNFLIDEVLYMIETLKIIPDWETFLSLKRIPFLEMQVQSLTDLCSAQKEEIRNLKLPKKD